MKITKNVSKIIPKALSTAVVIAIGLMGLLSRAALASADAELGLYEGNAESDLRDRILIHGQDGASYDYQYRKECSAFGGCKAVQSNTEQEAKLARIAPGDLLDLNAAVAKITSDGNMVAVTPVEVSLCRQFKRFVYEVKDSAGKAVKTEEIMGCAGTRLSDANAGTVERVLNIAASFAGL